MEAVGIRSKCVTVLIDGPSDTDPWGREALYAEDGTKVDLVGARQTGHSAAVGRQAWDGLPQTWVSPIRKGEHRQPPCKS